MGRDKHQLRAAVGRLDARHGRANAVLAGLIARRQDDAPRMLSRVRADDDRLAFEAGVLANLDGGVERVHVHMEDDATAGFRRGHASSPCPPAGIKAFAGEGPEAARAGSDPVAKAGILAVARALARVYGPNPKNARPASLRYTRKNTARIAVSMTIARAMNTDASIARGAATFAAPGSGSRMYMYQITRA